MLRDLRLAFRAFRKERTHTLAVALTLAVGVGGSTSIFTFVDAALLQPPPFPEPSKLGVIWGVAGPERAIRGASFLEIKDWKARARTLQDVVIYDEIDLNMSIDGGNPARVDAEMVSWSYFQMLGGNAVLGRTFTADEDAVPDQHPVAVISDALWHARFGANPDVFSRAVQLNDRAVTIVGVMQPGFSGLSFDTDVGAHRDDLADLVAVDPGESRHPVAHRADACESRSLDRSSTSRSRCRRRVAGQGLSR
jgi:hypothetical protein